MPFVRDRALPRVASPFFLLGQRAPRRAFGLIAAFGGLKTRRRPRLRFDAQIGNLRGWTPASRSNQFG